MNRGISASAKKRRKSRAAAAAADDECQPLVSYGTGDDDMLVSEETEAKLVHEITAEAVANMQLPTITFVEEWRPLIDRVDPDEMSEDLAGLTTTVGVIAALLMSMMFGESGMELYANENSIWGERVDMMKHAYTVLCAVTTVICFAAVIISARLYMAMLVCPKRLTVAAVATMGGTIVLEPLFVSFLAISIMTTVVIGLNATIQVGRARARAGSVALVVSLLWNHVSRHSRRPPRESEASHAFHQGETKPPAMQDDALTVCAERHAPQGTRSRLT